MVDKKDIKELGKCFVSTQMNQFCYLYLVFVNKQDQGEKHPENESEALSKTDWFTLGEIQGDMNLEDWKTLTIISKAQVQKVI